MIYTDRRHKSYIRAAAGCIFIKNPAAFGKIRQFPCEFLDNPWKKVYNKKQLLCKG